MADIRQASGPVDISHLRTVTLGDPVIERELLGLFSDRAAHAVRALLQAEEVGPRRAASRRLARAAQAVGAFRLAAIAGEIERRGTLTRESAAALSYTLSDVADAVAVRLAG